ncbi:MAG: DnaA/Hda family protein, partial [Chloroflexota bacterium]|nr:DnaA/Hda family protein [Chloroflexota bacterium]
MDYSAIWQAALGDLQLQMTKATFDTWLRDTVVLGCQDSSLTIAVRNTYAKEWLENRLLPTIRRTLARVAGESLEVDFAVRRRAIALATEATRGESAREQSRPASAASPEPRPELNGKYTFANFIVGSSNRFAHAAALAVAERPAQAYNPLFVYGGVGLGKTHLLHAIGHHAHGQHPKLSVLYVSSERFTNDLIESIRRSSTEALRQKYRQIDILLIDDIQFIAGKESTQEEFFHTFNPLHAAEKQVVISSDRPPRSIPTLEDR